tara:strand:+ start:338 stop:721 length:384 start_codon:yes stop_codon:yes gene_type:complete
MSNFEINVLREFPDDGPVVMLNLVKFREVSSDGNGTGSDAYKRYAEEVTPLMEKVGGRVLWAGNIQHPVLHEGGDVDWDWSVLVEYPNRSAFLELVSNSVYSKANVDRKNGVEKHVIMASKTVMEFL